MTTESEKIYPMRLQRFLARAGVASRRGSERLMSEGRVRVNGVVVSELGSKVDPGVDEVSVDGVIYTLSHEHCFLILNKPKHYLTTMSDPYERNTVASLVPTEDYPGLFPVGRLDQDTTGILLFTSDGDAGQALLHPSHHVSKHYVALVEGEFSKDDAERMLLGLELDDGRATADEVQIYASDKELPKSVPFGGRASHSCVGIRIHEGRKHQVKRMFSALSFEVVELHRDCFGPLTLDNCAAGTWRHITDAEKATLLAEIQEKELS